MSARMVLYKQKYYMFFADGPRDFRVGHRDKKYRLLISRRGMIIF